MNGIDAAQLAELEAAIESDPGDRVFPALAEVHRRQGRLHDAERVVREGLEHKPDVVEGRLVLALVMLDQGREVEARSALEQLTPGMLAAAGVSFAAQGSALSDSELDVAFREAETDADQLITPDRVAEEAVAHVDGDAAEGLDEGASLDSLEPGSAFATATMAELLERQGDGSGAERIRASLQPRPPTEPTTSARSGREHQIATLEGWLARIRGDRS